MPSDRLSPELKKRLEEWRKSDSQIVTRGEDSRGRFLDVMREGQTQTVRDPAEIRRLEDTAYLASEAAPAPAPREVERDPQTGQVDLQDLKSQFRERFPVEAQPRRTNEIVGVPTTTPSLGGNKAIYAVPGGSRGMDLGSRQAGDLPLPQAWQLTPEQKQAAGIPNAQPVGIPLDLLSKEEQSDWASQMRKEKGNEEVNQMIRRMQNDLGLTDADLAHLWG